MSGINFLSLSPSIRQKLEKQGIDENSNINKSDVAAIIAKEDEELKKKQSSSRADVAAVLAMQEQVPLKEGQRDLCLA